MAASRYGLQIRAVASADAPGLAALMEGSGHAVAAGVLAARIEALRDEVGAALVAIEWGPPSGLVVVNWFPTLEADLPVARIGTLLVDPDSRRRGIGRMLLKAASHGARAAGCGTLLLSVPDCDGGLRAFCSATGFSESGAVFERQLRKKGAVS